MLKSHENGGNFLAQHRTHTVSLVDRNLIFHQKSVNNRSTPELTMKIVCLLLLVLGVALPQVNSQECGVNAEVQCYCSGPMLSQNCDPTVRVTQISPQNTSACEALCFDYCGPTAGSSFSCRPNDEGLNPCNTGKTNCKCDCDHSVEVPSPIQFPSQCEAFCDRTDVCNSTGSTFSCGGGSGAPASWGAMEMNLLLALAGLAVGWF